MNLPPVVAGLIMLQRNIFAWTTVPIRSYSFARGGPPHTNQKRTFLSLAKRNHFDDSIVSLRNNYYALRHGQSLANVAKIIAANPEIACSKYGLSDVGKEQAKLAGQTVVEEFQSNDYNGILILSSDLLRAKETAEFSADAVKKSSLNLYNDDIVLETRLRERGFGTWDGGSDEHYNDVWRDDAVDPTHETNEVESVVSVMDRTSSMILDWDDKFENFMVICVAHGDVLQMLQTAFSRMDGSLHRTLEHLDTATLRKLPLAPNKES